MAIWIRIVTFTDEGIKLVRKDPAAVFGTIGEQIRSAGGVLKEAYITLGPFDALSLIEARDEEHMDQISSHISSSGLYVAEAVAAVPVREFLELSQRSPVFLKAWLDGRAGRVPADVGAGAKTSVGRLPAAKAASPAADRKPGVNTRRARRAASASGLALALPNVTAVEVAGISLGPEETDGAFHVRLPAAAAKASGVLDAERNTRMPFTLELLAEKMKVNLQGLVVRVDAAGDAAYDVVVAVKDLPRALVARLDKIGKRV